MEFDNNDINDDQSEDFGQRIHWVVIGEAPDRTTAEFAVNGLKSYGIPAVMDSKPGVLGSAGLKLRSFYSGKLETFKIMVPGEHEKEALELVKMFLDNKSDKPEGNGV